MENKKILLIAIAILIIAVIGIAAYSTVNLQNNASNTTDNASSNVSNTGNIKNSTSNATQNNTNNTTIVGDNSVLNISALNKTNGTYKIYDPQSDSYVTVIGEKFDNGVNRWYTYDKDGVRYYNTRINH